MAAFGKADIRIGCFLASVIAAELVESGAAPMQFGGQYCPETEKV
jgi:hypothetical protein